MEKAYGNNVYTVYAKADLSNMLTEPVREAHGIVWKVIVDGYDAQDDYEEMPPLGVGKHKFEVYFNRPMNVAVTPKVSFGVRSPYTQHIVEEDGNWNSEGTIYTVYHTITGKTGSDGVNRIYVHGAEDNEYFECPYENTRFNINIQAIGSLASGFVGKAGMGRVELEWNNEKNDFTDAMGFNVYRIHDIEMMLPVLDEYGNEIWDWDEEGNYYRKEAMQTVQDTIRVNQEIIDVTETSYTDYDVIPNETYYYYYKVLSSDLKEYDVSNVVAVTPLTSITGDANGSGEVDVADVITTVSYVMRQDPKPFIFEAADMNQDQIIDVLDVMGIVHNIINPVSSTSLNLASVATYTIENGVLYVDSPVAIGGIQVQLNVDGETDFSIAEDLNGFEYASAWLSDNDYLFMAYSMSGKTLPEGKHAVLHIGQSSVSDIRLSDAQGRNIEAVSGQATNINDAMGSKVMTQKGIFNLKGQKVASSIDQLKSLQQGVYIVNGNKVIR